MHCTTVLSSFTSVGDASKITSVRGVGVRTVDVIRETGNRYESTKEATRNGKFIFCIFSLVPPEN